jgi:hypothetical protein
MRGATSEKEGQLGLIPLSIKEIFSVVEKDQEHEYKISVSYIEVSINNILTITCRSTTSASMI